jgi:hypothetical protein
MRSFSGAAAPSAGVETDLYAIPAGVASALVSSLVVCNRANAAATFRISISPGGLPTASRDYVYFDAPVRALGTFGATLGLTPSPGSVIRVFAGSSTLSFSVWGTADTGEVQNSVATQALNATISPAAGVETDLYTVPANAISGAVSSLVVCNQAGAASFRVSISPGGAPTQVQDYVFYDSSLGGSTSMTAALGLTLVAGAVVRVLSSADGLAFSIWGAQVTN